MHLRHELMRKEMSQGRSDCFPSFEQISDELKQKVPGFGRIKTACRSAAGCFMLWYLFGNPAGARSGFPEMETPALFSQTAFW